MAQSISVVQDGALVEVPVDEDTYEEYERFLDPGAAEGDRGRARILPVIDDKGAEWTIWTFREDDDDPYTTTLHQFPSGVSECHIPHVDAKRLFDHTEEIMNDFEFLDDDERETIAGVLRGDS